VIALQGLEAFAAPVTFSRVGDPATGEFQDAMLLTQFGEADLDALSA
jgi:hypothetical protein